MPLGGGGGGVGGIQSIPSCEFEKKSLLVLPKRSFLKKFLFKQNIVKMLTLQILQNIFYYIIKRPIFANLF